MHVRVIQGIYPVVMTSNCFSEDLIKNTYKWSLGTETISRGNETFAMKNLRDTASRLKGGATKAEGGVPRGRDTRAESMKAESVRPAHHRQRLLTFQSYRPGLFTSETARPPPGRAARSIWEPSRKLAARADRATVMGRMLHHGAGSLALEHTGGFV